MATLTLPQITELRPDQAISELQSRSLNAAYASYRDLYVRLFLVSILQDKCEFDIAHINTTIEFFKSRNSIHVAAVLLKGHTQKGNEVLKLLKPTDVQLESVSETSKLIKLLCEPDALKVFPSWNNFKKFTAIEVERALVDLREVLLSMRIPSKRKPKRDIDMEADCMHKLKYSRESIKELDHRTLYLTLKDLIGEQNMLKEFDSPELLQHMLQALFDKVIQEEKYSKTLLASLSPEVKTLIAERFGVSDEDIVPPKLVDECLQSSSISALMDISKIVGIECTTGLQFLAKYDEIVDAIKKALFTAIDGWNRSKYSVKDIFSSLSMDVHSSTKHHGVRNPAWALVNSSCVVSKILREDGYTITEIGLRCDGVYVAEPISTYDSENHLESKCGIELQWFPNREQRENGKSLDTILAMDNTMARDPIRFIVFLFEGSQFVLEVNSWRLTSEHVGCSTLVVTACHTSGQLYNEDTSLFNTLKPLTPFKRVVIQARSMQDPFGRLIKQLEITSHVHPVSSTVEVLADALEFTVAHADLPFDRKLQKICEYPNILFQLPDCLRKTVFHSLAPMLESYWKKTVLYDNKYDTSIVKEAKKLLCDLISAGHDQTHVALVSSDHLRYMVLLIAEKTKHTYQALSVEKSNFHTIFRTIERINKETAISFCSVLVSGKLSGLDISRLVDQSIHGNVRILLVYTPQVLLSLQLTQKVDSVRVPASLRRANQIKTCTYTNSTVVGKLLLNAHEKFTNMPIELSSELKRMEHILHQRTQWREDVQEWISSLGQNKTHDAYKLVICEDMQYVKQNFEALVDSPAKDYIVHLHTVDCHEVDAEVELAAYFTPKDADGELKKVKEVNILVLLNAHLLSEEHRHHIASITIVASYNLILVMPSYNPEASVLQIRTPNSTLSRVLPGSVCRPLAEWDAVIGTTFEIEKRSILMFFGPLAKTSLFGASFSRENAKAHLVDTCEFLKVDCKVINNIIDTIFDVAAHEDHTLELAVSSSLHNLVAHLCVWGVKNNIRNSCLDISFFNFLTHSHMCQWLPQNQRVVAWVDTLLPNNSKDTWGKKIASQCQQLCTNIHSMHLIAAFAEGYHQGITPTPLESLSLLPSYQFVVADSSITQEELILQQCCQGSELNWEHESLESCSLDFVLLLVEAYPQPLKLLATLQPLPLFHLLESATPDRFPKAVQILEDALVALTSSQVAMELFSDVNEAGVVLSVLKWSLLSTGCTPMAKLRISTLDVCNLIKARIPISVEKPDTAQVIVALFLALDGPPGIIYQQTGLRALLLSDVPVDTIFHTNTVAHLGMASLEFVFNGHVRKQECHSAFLGHPFLVELVSWLDGSTPKSLLQNSVVLRECWRLSECAVAYFIAHAFLLDSSTITSFLQSYLHHIASRENADYAATLNNILTYLHKQCPGGTQVAQIICEFLPPDTPVLLHDPLLDALVKAMQQSNLRFLEEHFTLSPPRVNADKRYLPVESSPKLVRLLLQQYSDTRLGYPNLHAQSIAAQVTLHRSWLSENGWQTILDELVCQKKRAQEEWRALTFIFWLFCPSRTIPFFPKEEDREAFKVMVDAVDLAGSLQGRLHQASQFAKFLVAPYCLELVPYNFFSSIMGEQVAEEKVFLVANEDHVFPLLLHVFPRTLPQELHNFYKLLPFDLEASGLTFLNSDLFGVDVSSGVDKDRIHRNLFALRHIAHILSSKQPAKHQNEDDFWYLAHIILAWFWAMGFSAADVEWWLNNNNTGDPIDVLEVLGDHEDKIRKSLQGKSEFTKLTTIPLPHLIDVKVRLSSRVLHLMSSSVEDKSYTEHYFSSFLVPLGCDEESLRLQFATDYANIPQFCGKHFGALLASYTKERLPSFADCRQVYQEIYHRDFLEIPKVNSFISLCQPFTAALQDLLSSNPQHAIVMLNAAMQTIARYPPPLPSVLGHILFLSFPINSPLLTHLVTCIRDTKVKLCAHCWDELENFSLFMGDNPRSTFNRFEFVLEYFTGERECDIPKITPLGEPCHHPIKYSSKLLQSSLINQLVPHAQTYLNHAHEPLQSTSIPGDFFSGSHSDTKHPRALFLQKTKIHRELPAIRAQSFSNQVNLFGGQHSAIFFCNHLLQVDPKKGYAVFFVTPGGVSYLVQDAKQYNIYRFHTGKIQAKRTDKEKVAAAYANHDEAWTNIAKHAPPSSLIVLDGILLFKSPTGALEPYILSFGIPPEVTQYFHRKIYFFDVVNAAPHLGLQLAPEVERFLLLLCRWLFRLCESDLHQHPAKEDTRERVVKFFAQATAQGWAEGESCDVRRTIENRADMIANYLQRLLQRLSNNRSCNVAKVIRDTAQDPGQPSKWNSNILEVWPAVVKALQRHLQFTIFYHRLIISILDHTFLENHELLDQESLKKCRSFVDAIQAVEAAEITELVTSPTVTMTSQYGSATTLAERVVLDDGDFSDDDGDMPVENELPRAAPASIPDIVAVGSEEEVESDESLEMSDDEMSDDSETSSEQLSGEDEGSENEDDENEEREEEEEDEIGGGSSSADEDVTKQYSEAEDSAGIPRAAAGLFASAAAKVGAIWGAEDSDGQSEQQETRNSKINTQKRKGKEKKGGKEKSAAPNEGSGAASGGVKEDQKVNNNHGVRIQVNSIFGKQPALYLALLDPIRHKNTYEAGSGRVLGYVLHQNLYSLVRSRTTHDAFTVWLLDVFRSPLPDVHREWFLARCQEKALLIPPEPTPPINSLLVAYCLASTCPEISLRSWLLGAAVALPEEAKQFISRKNNEYGVHFCTSDALRELKRLGLYVEVLDFSHVGTGTKSIDDCYLQVISRFAGFHCFVYVRGLDVVEDLFLKWCCEYTHRCPWRFIYFENTDSTFNFPENRDRCSYTLMETGAPLKREKNKVAYTGSSDLFLLLPKFGPQSSWIKEPIATDNWIQEIKKDFSDAGQCIILNISPPGAGKSHLWNAVMAEERINNRHAVQVDCSNDELVERSMASILQERFPQEGQPALLIADEFHMLSSYHKEDLINWVSPRLHWLKVVLVANRSDNQDTLLLDAATKQLGSTVLVRQYDCRLSIQTIQTFTAGQTKDEAAIDFVVTWHRASRMLFSEESLSLRTVGRLIEQFHKRPELSDTAFIAGLAGVLLPKMPFLGQHCCTKFAKHLWDIFSAREHRKEVTLPKDNSSPIGVLVRTALADECGGLCSFPEFASRMKVSHTVHPIVRMAAWVRMVWTEKLKISSDDTRLQALLSCLARLQVVDQAKFPHITGEGLAQDLSYCEVFSKSGNFADLTWLVDVINHGNAINWNSVKEVWKTHHISSAQEFSHLLSVCPDPGACLESVFPKNLCTLIEGEDGTTIAESCVQFCSKDGDIRNPHSVYFTAAWNLFKNAPMYLEKFHVSLLNTLLWASQFAFSLMRVKENPVGTTSRLQQALFDLTRTHGTVEIVAGLWSHLFAGLLEVGTSGVSNAVALLLSRKVSPIPSEWPEVIKLLAQVEEKTATYLQLEKLYESGFFAPPPIASSSSSPVLTMEVVLPDAQFCTRLLELNNRTLSVRWQVAILTSDLVLPDFVETHTSKLEEGLVSLVDAQKIRLQGALGQALQKIKQSKNGL